MLGTPPEQPFYLQLDYTAPHGDFRRPAGPEPAPRHYDSFNGAPLPARPLAKASTRATSTTSRASSAKRRYLSPTDIHTYRVYYQKALESLRSIDDGVKQIVDTLGALHRLRNTYVIFTSDNGFFFGEHRLIGGKFLAYEPSTHLPFLIRGPGIKPGTATGELAATSTSRRPSSNSPASNADKSIDGRSLVPFMHDPEPAHAGGRSSSSPSSRPTTSKQNGDADRRRPRRPSGDRGAPRGSDGASASIVAPPKDYEGIRLGPYKYIAWPDGEKELYDINKDPYELNNIVRDPNFFPIRTFLHTRTAAGSRTCVGQHLPRSGRRNSR